MPCYCLCSRSRLALPQLEDNAKLCLTKTFSPPPPPPRFFWFFFPFSLLFSSLHCFVTKSTVICCIKKKRSGIKPKSEYQSWLFCPKNGDSVCQKARGHVPLCFSKGCLGSWHRLHLLPLSLQVVDVPGWHSEGWQQEVALLPENRAETLDLDWGRQKN